MSAALAITAGAFLWPAGKPPAIAGTALWAACCAPPAAWLAVAVGLLALSLPRAVTVLTSS